MPVKTRDGDRELYAFFCDKAENSSNGERKLYSLITIQECSQIFGRAPNSIRMAIYCGNLDARKTNDDKDRGVWLITFSSAFTLWGHNVQ